MEARAGAGAGADQEVKLDDELGVEFGVAAGAGAAERNMMGCSLRCVDRGGRRVCGRALIPGTQSELSLQTLQAPVRPGVFVATLSVLS